MKVLNDKSPIINKKQTLDVFNKKVVTALSTTLPIMKGDQITGTVDINKYFDDDLNTSSLTTIDDILTNNDTMIKVKNKTLKAAKTNSSVMIYGETGTGKELIAQSIHNHSLRKYNPIIVQNCSAIPLTLGESIFFGTTKGSFTGAENKIGLFEMADGGTLVLDEINSMDINLQSKLLRAIENGRIRRVGGKEVIDLDIRFVSTLNEESDLIIEENRMRSDLFYRLGVVYIRIPPLRDRKDDIPLLVNSFIDEYNIKMDKNIKSVSEDVMDLFMKYNWPGNVRELKHAIESAFIFAEGEIIQKDDLPYNIKPEKRTADKIDVSDKFCLNDAIKDYESKYIKLALESSDTLNDAAKLLQVSRQTLKHKIDSYGIDI